MTNEEIEQKITQLESEIRLARRAWRIDYEELTERLDNMGVKNLTEIAKGLHALKEEVNALKNKYDSKYRTEK